MTIYNLQVVTFIYFRRFAAIFLVKKYKFKNLPFFNMFLFEGPLCTGPLFEVSLSLEGPLVFAMSLNMATNLSPAEGSAEKTKSKR